MVKYEYYTIVGLDRKYIIQLTIISMCSASGGKVIGVGVQIYICLWTKKNLNRTLAINSPFQTLAIELLMEFID